MKKLGLLLIALLVLPLTCFADGAALAPFFPLSNTPIIVSVTNSASSATQITPYEVPTFQVMVTNTSATIPAFVCFGGSAVTCSATTGIPITGIAPVYFTLNNGQQYVSAITASSTTTLYIVGGRGGH